MDTKYYETNQNSVEWISSKYSYSLYIVWLITLIKMSVCELLSVMKFGTTQWHVQYYHMRNAIGMLLIEFLNVFCQFRKKLNYLSIRWSSGRWSGRGKRRRRRRGEIKHFSLITLIRINFRIYFVALTRYFVTISKRLRSSRPKTSNEMNIILAHTKKWT